MTQSTVFLETLKRCLKSKGLTYGDLAKRLDLSEASVKRIFAEGTLSLDRIGEILDVLQMSFLDVAKLSSTQEKPVPDTLTFDQESILAADRKLFAFFHLLLFGKTLEGIREAHSIPRKTAERYLDTLAEIGLLDRQGPKIKLLVKQPMTWLDDGPLRKAYRDQILSEFLSDDFDGARETNYFMTRSLSHGSQELVKRKLELLRTEINELAAVDSAALKGKARATSLMIAMRPFTFSGIALTSKG